jgi:hypothetical protein
VGLESGKARFFAICIMALYFFVNSFFSKSESRQAKMTEKSTGRSVSDEWRRLFSALISLGKYGWDWDKIDILVGAVCRIFFL